MPNPENTHPQPQAAPNGEKDEVPQAAEPAPKGEVRPVTPVIPLPRSRSAPHSPAASSQPRPERAQRGAGLRNLQVRRGARLRNLPALRGGLRLLAALRGLWPHQDPPALLRPRALWRRVHRRLHPGPLGWPGKAGIAFAAAFAAVVLLPAGMALTVHGKGGGGLGMEAWVDSWDAHTVLRVYHMETGQVTPVALNDWLVEVLAAQMSPDAPMDALQAAAVAARTYAVRALSHPAEDGSAFAYQHNADLTDSPVLDLPLLPAEAQAQRYGARNPVYSARLQQAVQATDGRILTYKGQPILAFLFGQSAGRTRDAAQALGRSLPYLPSVPCPDDAAHPVTQTLQFTPVDLAGRLNWPPSAGLPDPSAFRAVAQDSYGYVKIVACGDRTWSGTDFAARLGLASTHFQLSAQAGKLVVRVQGEGSGIGMSLHEAAAMAGRGKAWRDILSTFYPGTEVTGGS
ncbi:SpoIID/LytB domain-containing protein [Alicyclobacillus macrosporangiidus]|uniref:Stage II sporulation protein D n=1 Tax=Alicyclobacillus macrosporangiidus TaxID=392015 RepID=A0A1I7HYD5_9BACL|nr:SpoIID/LytB domain-containing protein [Alicyclobacillus macrosporangiidus]SFU65631.1 stage II sporulation protein D [Alicyclobacillus macrosporangiidus]